MGRSEVLRGRKREERVGVRESELESVGVVGVRSHTGMFIVVHLLHPTAEAASWILS